MYYGALKSTPYLWLDPILLASRVFNKNEIVQTKYFSAKVSPLPNDPRVDSRQRTYWRALKTLPNFEIIEGHYKKRAIRAKNVDDEF